MKKTKQISNPQQQRSQQAKHLKQPVKSSNFQNVNYASLRQTYSRNYNKQQLSQRQLQSIQLYADLKRQKFRKLFLVFFLIFIIAILAIAPFLPQAIIVQPNQRSQDPKAKILRFSTDFLNFFLILKVSFTITVLISLFFYLKNLIKTPNYLQQSNRLAIGIISLVFIIFNVTFTSWQKYNQILKPQTLSGKQQRQLSSYLLLIVSLLLFWTVFTNQILYKKNFNCGFFYEMPYFLFLFIWLLDQMLKQTINLRCIFGKVKQCQIEEDKIQEAMSFTKSITLSFPLMIYTMIPLVYIIFNMIRIIISRNKFYKRDILFIVFSLPFMVFFYFMLFTGGLFYLDLCSSRILALYSFLNLYLFSLHIMYSRVSLNTKLINEIQQDEYSNVLIKNEIN